MGKTFANKSSRSVECLVPINKHVKRAQSSRRQLRRQRSSNCICDIAFCEQIRDREEIAD